MDILIIKFNGWGNVVLSFDWVAAIILLLLIVLLSQAIKYIHKKHSFKTIQIDEATIGIGSSSVTIRYDGRIKEIAYKIWIELTTRKIGINLKKAMTLLAKCMTHGMKHLV
mgnify:CR=1 FL=1